MALKFMNKELVIVFVKNMTLGHVKTRLAKSIGNELAFEVYKALVNVTENATKKLNTPLRIYFSETIDDSIWEGTYKAVQKGSNLGERMKNAFQKAFDDGYERIVLIGSDLPDINVSHLKKGLKALTHSKVVFGPAEDGGYYLIGLSEMNTKVFNNKSWSQSHLLAETISELKQNNTTYSTLEVLNDIDTIDDLVSSDFYKNNKVLQYKIKELNA